MTGHKILTLEKTDQWVFEQKSAGRRIGFSCGAFDLVHAGHIQYLEEARGLCDALIVAVNTDSSIQRYKSPVRPIQKLADRQKLLAALTFVDAVTELDDVRPAELLRRWKPALYIKGGDYAPEQLQSSSIVGAYGGRTVVIPQCYPTSTSALIDRISTLNAHATPQPVPTGPNRIVFLDRDGTLIENVPFLGDPALVRLKDGVLMGLSALRNAGFRLVIATNQQGIGLGYYTMADFIAVNQRLLKEIGRAGGAIDRIYFCPHSFADSCDCRKPRSGMLKAAAQDFDIPLGDCYFIGDSPEDENAAAAVGVPALILGNNVADFSAAVAQILIRSL